MDYYKLFYFLTTADSIKHTFDIFSNWFMIFSILTAIIYVIVFIISKSEGNSQQNVKDLLLWRKYMSRSFWFSFIMMTLLWTAWAFTPTKKDAILILAGGAIGNFITSDSSAKQIPAELTLLVREKLKEEIKEIKSENITDTLASKSKEELIELLKKK